MRPIVAVVGTTGVGKSQLAVSLAQYLERSSTGTPANGRTDSAAPSDPIAGPSRGLVLSADSMQLYRGLDVITNKVTVEEQGGVEHWGLNMVTPGQGGSWELGKWCTEAGKVVDQSPSSTLPIICGGTHYFIQHFLFPPPELSTARDESCLSAASTNSRAPGASDPPRSARWSPPGPHPPTPGLDQAASELLETFWTPQPIWPEAEDASGSSGRNSAQMGSTGSLVTGAGTWTDSQLLSLHRLLAAVDPVEAGRWHWRDGRKVKRGLERWWERGSEAASSSAILAAGKPGGGVGRKARFRTLIFWVYEKMDELRPRLDRRADKMVKNGLLREIAELRGIAQVTYGSAEAADHTEGIFQAIGYKEFSQLPLDGGPNPTSHPDFPTMLDRMKLSTHQYAKSQIGWIRKQLLPAVREAMSNDGDVWVYVVAGGDANEAITRDVLQAFLRGDSMPDPRTVGHPAAAELLAGLYDSAAGITVPDIARRQNINARKDCDVCSTDVAPYSVMLKEWDLHIKSKLHKRNLLDASGGRQALIERQKLAGQAKKLERERLKEESRTVAPRG